MSLRTEVADEIKARVTSSRNDIAPDAVLPWGVLRDAIGFVISDMRRTWRQEQAAAVAELSARIDTLKTRIAHLQTIIGKPDAD